MEKTIIAIANNWNNGVIMIAIFALVCVILVGVVVNLMMSDKKKGNSKNE